MLITNRIWISVCVTGKVFWEAQDAARLGILTASTNNILSIAQTLVTAMVRMSGACGCSRLYIIGPLSISLAIFDFYLMF